MRLWYRRDYIPDMKITLAAFAILLALFVVTPTEPVSRYVGDEPKLVYSKVTPWMAIGDERPQKSGLRIAIEGRLRWLGF